jgi:hypothetical protein
VQAAIIPDVTPELGIDPQIALGGPDWGLRFQVQFLFPK